MQCGFLHILNFPAYIVHRFMYCIFLHVLCIDSCIVFPVYIVCCFMYCAWFDVLCTISIYPTLLHALCSVLCIAFCFIHAKSHFGHISGFLTIYIQNFFVLRINNLYFPFLLDISCYFLMIMSNFYLAKLFLCLHCS